MTLIYFNRKTSTHSAIKNKCFIPLILMFSNLFQFYSLTKQKNDTQFKFKSKKKLFNFQQHHRYFLTSQSTCKVLD